MRRPPKPRSRYRSRPSTTRCINSPKSVCCAKSQSTVRRPTSTPTCPTTIISSRSEEHTSELQSQSNLVCRLLLEKKNTLHTTIFITYRQPGLHLKLPHNSK